MWGRREEDSTFNAFVTHIPLNNPKHRQDSALSPTDTPHKNRLATHPQTRDKQHTDHGRHIDEVE